MRHAVLWYEMTDRERAVWCTAFSAHSSEPSAAAEFANRKLADLRTLAIEDHAPESPEIAAARRNAPIERHEFDAWFVVASRIASRPGRNYRDPTADECAEAYDRYARSAADFY